MTFVIVLATVFLKKIKIQGYFSCIIRFKYTYLF